jgi:predicted RNA binding protein YcfA (HicA-like mRNA interferase family)
MKSGYSLLLTEETFIRRLLRGFDSEKLLVKYYEENGFFLLREGSNHSIYTNNDKTIPLKRHSTIDRITANE